jgi:N-acetylglucosaminyldiphosphoundecaprenol N-acetyl-beta-D-mannosaminyltransferase
VSALPEETTRSAQVPLQPGSDGAAYRGLFGLRIDNLTLEETVQRCLAAADSGELIEIAVVNAAKIVNMRRDATLREAVAGCHVVVADGQSVVWASRLLGAPLVERVAGIDLFQRLLVEAEQRGLPVYFLGAKPEVLTEMVRRVAASLPGLTIAGSRHGYFTDDEAPGIADEIAESGAKLLFLGMTSPKKERFVAQHGRRTGASVVHGVGGSFDVLAGLVRRAPRSWQRLGLEWLYRAAQEPQRLGRRYLTTNAAFLAIVVRERLSRSAASVES